MECLVAAEDVTLGVPEGANEDEWRAYDKQLCDRREAAWVGNIQLDMPTLDNVVDYSRRFHDELELHRMELEQRMELELESQRMAKMQQSKSDANDPKLKKLKEVCDTEHPCLQECLKWFARTEYDHVSIILSAFEKRTNASRWSSESFDQCPNDLFPLKIFHQCKALLLTLLKFEYLQGPLLCKLSKGTSQQRPQSGTNVTSPTMYPDPTMPP
jgi:hypothetical protein